MGGINAEYMGLFRSWHLEKSKRSEPFL